MTFLHGNSIFGVMDRKWLNAQKISIMLLFTVLCGVLAPLADGPSVSGRNEAGDICLVSSDGTYGYAFTTPVLRTFRPDASAGRSHVPFCEAVIPLHKDMERCDAAVALRCVRKRTAPVSCNKYIRLVTFIQTVV